MESCELNSPSMQTEQTNCANKTESAENFQKFIYELFDKNGILNDLRAYLRGHIINVLRNAQSDEPPACQRHFTQRLEPIHQALNMLVAEYLLCMEFSYSLSVFVSEIPLANMVFTFARSLMDLGPNEEATGLRFKEADVWSILNYLGLKCDSENANKIVAMYKAQKDSPLLLCVLKCSRLHNMEPLYSSVSQEGSVSSESKTDAEPRPPKCKHHVFCRNCHVRFNRLKEKYQRKKKHFVDSAKHPSLNARNVESVMKKIGAMEKNLLEEMFDQLKTVYEAEIDMVRSEHDDKIKRSLANHALHFQERRTELEESFKARERALEDGVERKKQFLWGVATSLRRQHEQMAAAMRAVRGDTEVLADKERSFKAQLTDAEASLKKRGEQIRQQIADELSILQKHLESFKLERDSLNRERFEHETRRCKANTADADSQLKAQYDSLKLEFGAIKKLLECSKDTRFTERGTITERVSGGLNNEDPGTVRDTPIKVVNDLKKPKNVNFCQGSSTFNSFNASFQCIKAARGPLGSIDLARLAEDSERLRLPEQQWAHAWRLPARPRSAPAPARRLAQNMNATSTVNANSCKGAGEQLGFALGPIVLPGDVIPFVGGVGQRAHRWRLLDQKRGLRRASPPDRSGARDRSAEHDDPVSISSLQSTHSQDDNSNEETNMFHASRCNLRSKTPPRSQQARELSPKSVLKEAKEKLRTVPRASSTRQQSPSAILREAKRRLRKLEIEAEAVERSCMDFRRRRLRPSSLEEPSAQLNIPKAQYEETSAQSHRPRDINREIDFEKYLVKFQHDLNIGTTHFRNRKTAAETKQPIPQAFDDLTPKRDYLTQPLAEFRRLYHTRRPEIELTRQESDPIADSDNASAEKAVKAKQETEPEYSQENKEIYSLDEPTKEIDAEVPHEATENLLRVEFDNTEGQSGDLLVVVSSAEPTVDYRSDVENARLTIIVSPERKQNDVSPLKRSPSPEGRLTRDVSEAFLEAGDQTSNAQSAQLDMSGRHSGGDDYADDFSGDVDNYKSERDTLSPVSLPESSGDENFWE